jgi:adenylyl-sulfate kinase
MERIAAPVEANSASEPAVTTNVSWEQGKVTAKERAVLFRHEPATIWLTGLSGSGKSTLAFAVEKRLLELGHACCVLDGDNIRHGLNRDLGFSPPDRTENIRRVAEVAKLLNEAGGIVVTAFISPYAEDRDMARQIIGAARFIETYLSADLEVCEKRDAKGLYAKARAGKIADFTGISAPYVAPTAPDAVIDTGSLTPEDGVDILIARLRSRLRE